MSKYNILFSIEKNLYFDKAPILLEAGALVCNTENKRVHIQLKFKNLSKTAISMLKVSFVLMDSVGRMIGCAEKQYIDLRAKFNESFADKEPAYLNDNTVRRFSVTLNEVCFMDGSVWTAPENYAWEQIPQAKALEYKLTAKEAVEEFKTFYCKKARFVPFAYKDLWICACGNINKNDCESCGECGAKYFDMEAAENETLKYEYIYRKAMTLVNGSSSYDIRTGIALFEGIVDWKDSMQLREKAKQKLVSVVRNEQEERKRKAKQKKKKIAVSMLLIIVSISLFLGILIGSSISKANKYKQAQEYMAQHDYFKAGELLDELDGYKDADNLYLLAKYMTNGEYKNAIQKFNLTEIYIPNGTKVIENLEFSDCKTLKKVVIPDSVIGIGYQAFYNCSSLTEIIIPDSVMWIGSYAFYGCSSLKEIIIPDSVTSIGDGAFYGCDSLTSIEFKGTVEEWDAIEKGGSWNDNVPATEVVCSNGTVTL